MGNMEALEAFWSPEGKKKRKCQEMFYIFHFLKNSEKCCGIGGEGLETFQNQAASWSQKIIPFELKERNFTEVLNGLKLLLIHRVVLAIEKKKRLFRKDMAH